MKPLAFQMDLRDKKAFKMKCDATAAGLIASLAMTAAEPIDLDLCKFEEDIYGENVGEKIKDEPREPSVTPTKSPKKGKGKHGLPSDRTSRRRHVDDADVQDRVLVTMVDSGVPWR